jgi:hypothetical protein
MHVCVEIGLSVLINRMFVNIVEMRPNHFNIFIYIIILVCPEMAFRVGMHRAKILSKTDKDQSQHISNPRVIICYTLINAYFISLLGA